jgi:hypothetical protein
MIEPVPREVIIDETIIRLGPPQSLRRLKRGPDIVLQPEEFAHTVDPTKEPHEEPEG